MNRNIKSYLREVSAKLKGSRVQKKEYISNLRNEVLACFGDDETVTVDRLCAEFGTPDVIAQGFAGDCDYSFLVKRLNKITIAFSAIVVALSLLLSATIYIIVETVNAANGTYTVHLEVSDTPFEENQENDGQ